ncbi:MAG: DUF2079 domain-containing protein [Sandaracinaceae bacterium]|nr:DUF2079 domain-containing protein [Sandaracinaceae bacterium]
MTQRRAYLLIATVGSLLSAMLFMLAWQRYATFHNRTFDLAFYARIAWGLVHLQVYDSIVGGHVLGLHLSAVLIPLGALGSLFGTVRTLLSVQALAYGIALWPLAQMGERRFGPKGAVLGAFLWLFYPNLGHVLAFEFHPGTLAIVPLAFLADALDRKDARRIGWSVIGVLLCREDLALVTAIAGAMAMRVSDPGVAPAMKKMGRRVLVGSVFYFLVFALVLHPIFAPPQGSMVLHFGAWGNTVPQAAWYLVRHPLALVTHLMTQERLLYLPKILLPLGLLLPLLGFRFLLPTLPILAINLFSQFPTTTELASHYLTPAVPFLVAAALDGADRLLRTPRAKDFAVAFCVPVLIAHVFAGGTWLSRDCPLPAFQEDDGSRAARAVVAQIPDEVSVQAPDALLPHLAERRFIHRAPPPERGVSYTVLDVSHRQRLEHRGDVLRATEEPFVRDWLGRRTQEVLVVEGGYILTRRASVGRSGYVARYRVGDADPNEGTPLTACLSLLSARLRDHSLEVDFVARSACASDLGLRVGADPKPHRIDLLFNGVLSPALLERGDRVRSTHALTDVETARIRERGLYLGLVRQSEARPDPTDPDAVRVELH